MQKDSTFGTIFVAGVLCVVCSILVATSAVGLKPLQIENKKLDIKKNILLASGLIDTDASKEQILEAYKVIKTEVVDLDSGKITTAVQADGFDQRKARKNAETNKAIEASKDSAGIKTRSKYSLVYKVMEGSTVKMIILPINGKGLWSTLYGFVALSPDTETIQGLGFYEHGETPGLGGEVDNQRWKDQWRGKKAFDSNFKPKIRLIKGVVSNSDAEKDYKIDGLSGATITAVGVTGLVQYWLGEDGFGPYLANLRQGL